MSPVALGSLLSVEGRHHRSRRGVLLITADGGIQTEVCRLAALASVPVEVVAEETDALRSWHAASLVLVGADRLGPVARQRPTRRRDVAVVHAGIASLDVFRDAYELGAEQVVELPSATDWLADALSEKTTEVRHGAVIGFVAAAGGAGSTSLAVATACVAAERTRTALIDMDPLGPGVERVIGYEEPSVTTWSTLGTHSLSPPALREALPVHDGVHLIGFGSGPTRPVDPAAVTSILTACAGAFDLTIVDLPRSTDSAVALAVERCDLVVVCSTQSIGASLSGRRLVESLSRARDLVAVTRGGARTTDPREVVEALQVPLLIDVPDQRGLDEVLGIGGGPLRSRGSGLRRAALAVLDRVSGAGHGVS